MNVLFRESFDKDLSAITDAGLLRRVQKMIEQVETARTFREIPNLKRLDAKGKYFRIRLGDYRVDFVFEPGAVTFVRCLHRREIYRYFPLLREQANRFSWARGKDWKNHRPRIRSQVFGCLGFGFSPQWALRCNKLISA